MFATDLDRQGFQQEYVLPDNPSQLVKLLCPGDPNEHNQLLMDKIEANLNTLVDYILAIRPDIRIVLPTCDYAGRYDTAAAAAGCDLATQHEGMMLMDLRKQRIAASKHGRVFFCNNYGLMQYTFGVFDYAHSSSGDIILSSETPVYPAGYVKPGFDVSDYPPLLLPEPDNLYSVPLTCGGRRWLRARSRRPDMYPT